MTDLSGFSKGQITDISKKFTYKLRIYISGKPTRGGEKAKVKSYCDKYIVSGSCAAGKDSIFP